MKKRSAWVGNQPICLPGMSPPPGPFCGGWKPKRSKKIPPPLRKPPPAKIVGNEGVLIIDDPQAATEAISEPDRDEVRAWYATAIASIASIVHERPSSWDHPLAVAARAGRASVLWHVTRISKVPDPPTDPIERRAYDLARARWMFALGKITPSRLAEVTRSNRE